MTNRQNNIIMIIVKRRRKPNNKLKIIRKSFKNLLTNQQNNIIIVNEVERQEHQSEISNCVHTVFNIQIGALKST